MTKPKDIFIEGMEIRVDKADVVFIVPAEWDSISLVKTKQLHAWLGKAIKYLESKDKK